MVLRTRTNCSFKWRACMELRCDWRSTNISETSRFEYSIRYILRLLAVSSTENAQCGVLPSLEHLSRSQTCCTAPEISCIHWHFPRLFRRQASPLPCGWTRPAVGGRRDQHPGRPMQWKHVGGGRLGENGGRPGQEQSRCLKTEQAHPGNADP